MIIKLLDWIFLFSFHLTVLYLKMGVWWHTGSGKSWDSTKHMQRALLWWHTGSGKSWNSIKHVEGILSIGNIQEVWYSCAGTGNACEAFVMTCRQISACTERRSSNFHKNSIPRGVLAWICQNPETYRSKCHRRRRSGMHFDRGAVNVVNSNTTQHYFMYLHMIYHLPSYIIIIYSASVIYQFMLWYKNDK